MLIISAGMQKSGSAYFYNIINEVLTASGAGVDARAVRNDYHLDGVMNWDNNNIRHLTTGKLLKLLRVSRKAGTFTVKTHFPPSLALKIMNSLGLVRIIYSYRDPRDVLLSVIDHGNKSLSEGKNQSFAKIASFDKALPHVCRYLKVWQAYHRLPGILSIKYETMMQDPLATLRNIEGFLDVSLDEQQRQDILWKYSKDNTETDRVDIHLNKAETHRYKQEMTAEQQSRCRQAFGDLITSMGYEVE